LKDSSDPFVLKDGLSYSFVIVPKLSVSSTSSAVGGSKVGDRMHQLSTAILQEASKTCNKILVSLNY